MDLEHLALGEDRVADEHRRREALRPRTPGWRRWCRGWSRARRCRPGRPSVKRRVHQRPAELRPCRDRIVEVHGGRVHGQGGEEHVVGLGDRAGDGVLDHLAGCELLEPAPRVPCHVCDGSHRRRYGPRRGLHHRRRPRGDPRGRPARLCQASPTTTGAELRRGATSSRGTFYNAHGRGRLDRHRHPRGVRRRRPGHHRGLDRARGGRRVRRGDERLLGDPPVDLRHGTRSSSTASTGAGAERTCRGSPTGELHVAFGVTEPDAGTDTTSITHPRRPRRRRVRRAGAEGVDHEGAVLREVLLLVRTTPLEECAKPHRRHDAAAGRPAAARGRHHARSPSSAATPSCRARCATTTCRAGRADRVGEEGQGFRYLLDGLNPERILIASEALGIGRAALRQGRRLRQRARRVRPADRPEPGHRVPARRGAHAAARRRAGDPRGVVALRPGPAVRRGRRTWPSTSPPRPAFFAADRAMQTHGGFGYAKEYDVERYWREARLMRIAPVSQEMVLQLHRRRTCSACRRATERAVLRAQIAPRRAAHRKVAGGERGGR